MIQRTLLIPGTPPSLNVIAGRGSRYAEATLRFTVRRRRDEGNHRALLEKALGDVLVEGGWLDDDTPEHFSFGEVRFEVGGESRTAVLVRGWREGEGDPDHFEPLSTNTEPTAAHDEPQAHEGPGNRR